MAFAITRPPRSMGDKRSCFPLGFTFFSFLPWRNVTCHMSIVRAPIIWMFLTQKCYLYFVPALVYSFGFAIFKYCKTKWDNEVMDILIGKVFVRNKWDEWQQLLRMKITGMKMEHFKHHTLGYFLLCFLKYLRVSFISSPHVFLSLPVYKIFLLCYSYIHFLCIA